MSPPKTPRIAPSTTTATKVSVGVGIVAAMVLSVLLNVLVSRHYRRWDWTRGGLYTLSDATTQTLHTLEEPIHVYVLLSEGEALTLSLRHLLDAYGAETTRLEVEYIDPDRRPAELLAVRQRFGIAVGKTDDGKIVADAAVVVARGDRPHFLTVRDLVEVDAEDDLKKRPRLEHALTGAIRSVMSDDRPKICFSTGHGEGSVEPGAGANDGGLAPFRESLTKSNFEVVNVPSAHDGGASKDGALDACSVLVIAGPTEKVPPDDAARFKAFAEHGGSVFVAIGPQHDDASSRYVQRGLDGLLGLFGIKRVEDFVFELDPSSRLSGGFGEAFLPTPKPHAITEGLLKLGDRRPPVVLTIASSLAPTGAGSGAPVPLLVTSDHAFGMTDFFTWAKTTPPPLPGKGDTTGPLVVAYASELPKASGSSAPHGARMVVVSSASALFGANWQLDELRGTSVFVGSAVAWLAARPVLVDVPTKPASSAGLRVSEGWLGSTFRYVVLYIPLAAVLLGVAVFLRRRAGERRKPASNDEAREGDPFAGPDR